MCFIFTWGKGGKRADVLPDSEAIVAAHGYGQHHRGVTITLPAFGGWGGRRYGTPVS